MERVTVAVRVRPPKDQEATCVSVLDQKLIVIGKWLILTLAEHPKRRRQLKYAFDIVLDDTSSQQTVYENTAKPLLESVMDGYHATVFAYGATGCGKTHTITGTPDDPGIIFRTMQDLYSLIEQKTDRICQVTFSFLEVYNETIRDLMVSSSSSLDLREDDTKVMVAGLSEHRPSNLQDLMQLLMKGNANRTRAPTEANQVSSRSHAVMQIHIRHRDQLSGMEHSWTCATLSIIDLAGSEVSMLHLRYKRASVTKNKGERLLEGANINRSLLALGNCINALCSDKTNHVPYRDSKLTRLLKYSLGGNCKVVMIANISPLLLHFEETHNTLKYANRAKNIKTQAKQNNVNAQVHFSQYPLIIEQLKQEISNLKQQLAHSSQTSSNIKMESIELEESLAKLRLIYGQLREKEIRKCYSQFSLDRREFELTLLRKISLVQSFESLNNLIEEVESSLPLLRHHLNIDETAISAHRQSIKKIQSKLLDEANLSMEQKNYLCQEIAVHELSLHNARLQKQQSLNQEMNSLWQSRLELFVEEHFGSLPVETLLALVAGKTQAPSVLTELPSDDETIMYEDSMFDKDSNEQELTIPCQTPTNQLSEVKTPIEAVKGNHVLPLEFSEERSASCTPMATRVAPSSVLTARKIEKRNDEPFMLNAEQTRRFRELLQDSDSNASPVVSRALKGTDLSRSSPLVARSSPARRTKRIHARQSLIPIMSNRRPMNENTKPILSNINETPQKPIEEKEPMTLRRSVRTRRKIVMEDIEEEPPLKKGREMKPLKKSTRRK